MAKRKSKKSKKNMIIAISSSVVALVLIIVMIFAFAVAPGGDRTKSALGAKGYETVPLVGDIAGTGASVLGGKGCERVLLMTKKDGDKTLSLTVYVYTDNEKATAAKGAISNYEDKESKVSIRQRANVWVVASDGAMWDYSSIIF